MANKFSVILSDLIVSHDMSQRELAKAIDTSNSTISRLMSGKAKYPDAEVLIKLADYFGVTTDYLLGRE